MSRFIELPSTVREDLGDGDWVDIKANISWGELLDLFPDEAAEATGTSRTRRGMQGLLNAGVAGWGGPGFEGLPFSPEAIARLRPLDATRIAQLVGKWNEDVVSSPKAESASTAAASDFSTSPNPDAAA